MPQYYSANSEDRQLLQRMDEARCEAQQPLSREEVGEIVREMLTTLEGDLSAGDLRLYSELESLARYIQHVKGEIAAVRPDDIRSSHIPTATDELDAVVGATESATNTIMDACDHITTVAGNLEPQIQADLIETVTRVFEACNFQDITGQRITKVVHALKHIETKIDALMIAFGEQGFHVPTSGGAMSATAHGGPAEDPDAALMHGPSLPGDAIDQDEIDRLLASFD